MTAYRIDPSPRRIRAQLGSHTVGDTINAKLIFITDYLPEYYFPADDIDWDILECLEVQMHIDTLGSFHAIVDRYGKPIGRRYMAGPAEGLVKLNQGAMDAWYEEDEQMWSHPKDPYRRVDVLESSRTIEIVVDGVTVATTTRPRLVAETDMPPRWYIPRSDVNWSLLTASVTTTTCPYKGLAEWWNVTPTDGASSTDVVWGYAHPIAESPKLEGLVAFLNEHEAVTTLVDGVPFDSAAFGPAMFSPSMNITNIEAPDPSQFTEWAFETDRDFINAK